jgi:predicted ATPase
MRNRASFCTNLESLEEEGNRMSDTTAKPTYDSATIEIRNFRSIKKQSLDLSPITIVYGPNAAGKSSVLYALLTLKNIILSSNQNPSGFFNFGFVSLGGLEQVVFDHKAHEEIGLGLSLSFRGARIEHFVTLQAQSGRFRLSLASENPAVNDVELTLPVTFPYPGNQQAQGTITIEDKAFPVSWTGILATVQSPSQDTETIARANNLAAVLNLGVETLRSVVIVPVKRGFTKPLYTTVAVPPLAITEDEIATTLSADKYLVSKVSNYLESIVERDFRVHFQPGTAVFTLDVTDKRTGIGTELVNDGFGVNQLVHILARSLRQDVKWVLLEEPEIHLHPSAVRGLAKALTRIVREEGKQFLISTQSESLILALLALVARHELEPSQLGVHFARKVGRISEFEKQAVNKEGQMEGGLVSFVDAELEDLKEFFRIDREARQREK